MSQEFTPIALSAVSATSLSAATGSTNATTLWAGLSRQRGCQIVNQTDVDMAIVVNGISWGFLAANGAGKAYDFGGNGVFLPESTTIKAYPLGGVACTTGRMVVSDFF